MHRTLPDLIQALETGLLSDEVTRDLESSFHNQLLEHEAQYSSLLAEQDGDEASELSTIIAPPPKDVADAEDKFRRWRLAYLRHLLDLDARLPVLKTSAERMRVEVSNALVQRCGGRSLIDFVHQQLLRRHGLVQNLRKMAVPRQRLWDGVEGSDAAPGSRGSNQKYGGGPSFTRLLDKELDALVSRLQCVRSQTSFTAVASSVPWLCSAIVLVRQFASEDLATRGLRRFLTQLQYLGLKYRARLWKRSLDFQAIMRVSAQGEAGSSSNIQATLPLGVASRKHLERALQDLGPTFGCSASLQSDKGKTFAHQVTLMFPEEFDMQQQRMEFKVYPVGGVLGVDHPDDLGIYNGIDVQPAKPGGDESGSGGDVYYLRESGWAAGAPWKAHVEAGLLEQGVLLRASFGAEHTPKRVRHKQASYAQQLVKDVLASVRPAAAAGLGSLDSWEVDVDSVLRAEWAFLVAGDAKMAIRRLSELAEQPAASGAARGESDGTEERHAMPQPLLRGYFMLRHLQCRAQRWRLLCLLNFFRFVLRRLVHSLEAGEGGAPRPASQRGAGGQRGGEERAADRYWDLSPRALTRCSRNCPMPFAVRADGSSGARGAEQPPSREGILRLEDDTFVVVDGSGRRVVHAAALDDLAALEREMLSIGSYYIQKFESSASGDVEQLAIDRISVLFDLYAAEVWFNTEKRNLLEVYLEIYEHTADPLEKRDLEQRIVNVMAVRPRLNLEEDPYFTDAYSASICTLNTRTSLLRSLLSHQIASERAVAGVSERLVQSSSSSSSSTPAPSGGRLREGELPRRATSRKASMSADVRDDVGGVSIDAAMLALAHPREGYRNDGFTDEATCVQLSPAAEPVGVDEFCQSACLVWKVELLLEEVHHDLVRHFHPSSPLMVTLLERACYSFASEQWRSSGEGHKAGVTASKPCAAHDNPEVLLQIVREVAVRLSGGISQAQADHAQDDDEEQQCPPLLKEVGGLDVSGLLHQGFAELRRKCGYSAAALLGHMLAHLLEHLHLRRRISDAALEVLCLEGTLRTQAVSFGTRLEAARPPPVHDTSSDLASGDLHNTWIDPSGPTLAAGMLSADMGVIDLSSGRSLALHCSPQRVQELRRVHQHELAYRNLLLSCVQYNTLLLDPQVRQKEISDVMLVGPSRDLIAGDACALAMRRFRETLELSGPLRNDRPPQARGKNAQRKPKNADVTAFMDMSRYSHFLQTPLGHLKPILEAVGNLHQEKVAALRSHSRPAESDRQSRVLWYILLVCSSTFINACARDLSMRVQAVDAAITIRSITALIPSKLSPFDRTVDHKQPLVERDGQVVNLFSIPTALEILQLRSTSGVQDVASAMKEFLSVLAPGMGEKSKTRELSLHEVSDLADEGQEANVSPELHISFTGPAATVLRILHGLTTLVVLRYSLATVVGDPLTLLRMRRHARFSLAEVEGGQEDVGDMLSLTEPTFEALEEMCSDLARLAWRLDGLGDAARDPARVVAVLHSEVRAAHRELTLLLRLAVCRLREGVSHAAADDAADDSSAIHNAATIQGWDGLIASIRDCQAEAKTGSVVSGAAMQVPHTFRGPLASLGAFAGVEPFECDTRLLPVPVGQQSASTGASQGTTYAQPELTSFREDLARYVQEIHPRLLVKHPLLHPFLRTLLGSYATGNADSIGVSGNDRQEPFQPHMSRLPWRFPPAPLQDLVSVICTLPRSWQRQVSHIRAELAEKHEEFFRMNGVKTQSNEAADADAEFFGCLLLRDFLKEHLGAFSVPKHAPSSGHDSALGGISHDLGSIRHQIEASVLRLDQKLVAVAIARLGCEFTAVVELRHRSKAPTSKEVLTLPDVHAKKVDSLLYALNRLRASGTYVQMDPHGNSGERAYVFKERDLDACIEELVAALPRWGANAVRGRERLASELLGCLGCGLERRGQGLARRLGARAPGLRGSAPWRDAWARSEVAGRGCRLVLEVDRLHRLVKELKVVSNEIEHRLGSEIWERARGAIAVLTGALSVETGCYKENYGDRAHSLASQLRDIREHITTGLATLASKNYGVQERALQDRRSQLPEDSDESEEAAEVSDVHVQPQPLAISDGMFQKLREVAQRDDVETLRLKVRDLERRQARARFFHHFKIQTLRQRFEERMKALHMTLESNSELSERLAHASQSERVVAREFTATARGMSLAEQRIEELRSQVEADTEHRHRLQNWRRSKAKQLAHIDQAVRDHQRVGSADAEGLLGQLSARSEQLQQLQRERAGEEAAVEAAARGGRQRAAQARQQLRKQCSAKDSARQELQDLRADVERGGLDGEARLRLWHGRMAAAAQQLEELQRESRRLRQMLAPTSPEGSASP